MANQLLNGGLQQKLNLVPRYLANHHLPRILSTPQFRAFLKITEGCNNRCSYCMIPTIRGSLRSRKIADIISEAQTLAAGGVQELTLIAQDLTAYGHDFTDNKKISLTALLQNLLNHTDIPWLRLLYLYPSGITDELLSLMQENKRILPYLDIPFQHVSDHILQAMNRPYRHDFLQALMVKIRSYLPNAALRSTFMVGFPSETEQDIQQLADFLHTAKIDNLGVFAYNNEAGSPSEKFSGQIPADEKKRRLEYILSTQAEISTEIIAEKYQGQTETVLIEGLSKETDLLLEGRTKYQAADVDGCVYITEGFANAGDFVKVLISETNTYDLVGKIV
jgi:ribosomal protein S12 methylthiotransferase